MKTLTTDEFINKANTVHKNIYDYSKVIYKSSREKVIITCKIHGDFLQTASSHLRRAGCPICSGNSKLTTDKFISNATAIHGFVYTYDKVTYKNSTTKVIITCREHGDFLQRPYHHILGQGCPSCFGKFKLTTDEFIDKARNVHGDVYDYSKVTYIDNKTKVTIVCIKHGDFLQSPNDHLANRGCPACFGLVKHTFKSLSEAVNNKHKSSITLVPGQTIDGSKKKYKFRHSCGYEWVATANHILNGSSCPKCCTSGFKSDKPAVFYILDINGDSKFTGFGISNVYKKRRSVHKRNLKNNNCSIVSEILISAHGSAIQQLEEYVKQSLQCNNSSIKGFKTESVLMTPKALLDFCVEWLVANGKEYSLSS